MVTIVKRGDWLRPCKGCGRRPGGVAEFKAGRLDSHGARYRCSRCVDCSRTQHTNWSRSAGGRQRTPEYAKAARIKSYFGITTEEYEFRLSAQGVNCAICQQEMERPSLDHNHQTGQIREFLCQLCNTMIGMARENTSTLTAAITYLEKHK